MYLVFVRAYRCRCRCMSSYVWVRVLMRVFVRAHTCRYGCIERERVSNCIPSYHLLTLLARLSKTKPLWVRLHVEKSPRLMETKHL